MRFWAAVGVLLVPVLCAQGKGSISGTVVDATGAVIPGATVRIDDVDSHRLQSDSAGRFAFLGLDAGIYKLTIERRGFHPSELTIALSEGEEKNLGQLDLHVTPPPPNLACPPTIETIKAAGSGGTLTGRVLTDAKPTRAVVVKVHVAGSSSEYASTTTDRSGRFKTRKLTPGIYDITLNPNGPEPIQISNIRIDGHSGLQLTVRSRSCIYL